MNIKYKGLEHISTSIKQRTHVEYKRTYWVKMNILSTKEHMLSTKEHMLSTKEHIEYKGTHI